MYSPTCGAYFQDVQLFVVIGGVPGASALGVAPGDGANSEVLGPDDIFDELIPFADDDFRSVGFRLAGSESSGLRRRFIWPLLMLCFLATPAGDSVRFVFPAPHVREFCRLLCHVFLRSHHHWLVLRTDF